jgi:hypothetical protein
LAVREYEGGKPRHVLGINANKSRGESSITWAFFAHLIGDGEGWYKLEEPEVIPLRRGSAPVHLILRLNILEFWEIRNEGSGAA